MANEISSTMLAQGPDPVKESSQLVKPEMDKSTATVGQTLSSEAKQPPQKKVEQAELQEAISEINDYVQAIQRDLLFNMDDQSGRIVISVIDSGSGNLIRQIPSEEVLAMANYLKDVSTESTLTREVTRGILFSKQTA